MQNTIKAKIAQITLALALTLGGALSAHAASLDQIQFGQSSETTVAQSATAKPSNMICFKDNEFIFTDTKVDAFMGAKIDIVKYAFVNDKLYYIEVSFKKNTYDDYNKLVDRMNAKYGQGQADYSFYEVTGTEEQSFIWNLDGKRMILTYMKNKKMNFDNIFLGIVSDRLGVNAVSK